jgi:hypothetical protein
MVERTGGPPDGAGRHLGVQHGGRQVVVTEQRLDDSDVRSVLQKVSREAVALIPNSE